MDLKALATTHDATARDGLEASVDRLALKLGLELYQERRRRRMTIRDLAAKAGVSVGTVHGIEAGVRGSLEMYVRLTRALGHGLDVAMMDPGRRGPSRGDIDIVHAAMGELEVAELMPHGVRVAADEPWQHFHFAGRADVAAWVLEQSALLHLENRTQLPDVQDATGRFNTKRRYLGEALWRGLGFDGRPRSETHVMVALWSSEILRVLRQRPATFRSTFPDPPDAFFDWLSGRIPTHGRTTSFVLLDPFATGRQRQFLELDAAIDSARSRVHGYAEAAELLRRRR
jgi:transcriptional regulator with XRE-family HTH domain